MAHTFHEILVLFGHLAAVTERLEFVTSVLVLPQRQAALAAKQIATVHLLSGGRIRVAVGVGWNFAEYEALGVDFAHRTDVLDEQIDVMRALWTESEVSYHGHFHHLDGVGINPRPPGLIPVYIGTGASDAALRRVVAKADGWMPLVLPGLDPIDLRSAVARLREIANDEGRDPETLPIHGRVYSARAGRGRWTRHSSSASRTSRSASTGWRTPVSITRSTSTRCSTSSQRSTASSADPPVFTATFQRVHSEFVDWRRSLDRMRPACSADSRSSSSSP